MYGYPVSLFHFIFSGICYPQIDGIFDVVEMSLKSLHNSSLGLSHILHITFSASDAVDEIGTFASDVFLAFKCFWGIVASNCACGDEKGTVSTVFL